MGTKTGLVVFASLLLMLAVPAARAAEGEKKGGKAEKIALDQVPADVKAAAEQSVKGIVLTEAEKKTKKGVVVWELTGKADGKEYEVKVSADAKVIRAKQKDNKNEEKEEKEGNDKED